MRSASRVTRKRKKQLKKLLVSKSNKSSDNKSDISSECDSDLQLPSSKRAKSNESNELNVPHKRSETNSQHEDTLDFNKTIEHCLNKVKETISLNSNELFSNNEVKPSEPNKEKKKREPAINYILLKSKSDNVLQLNKFSKPNVDPIHDDDDDDDNYNNDDDDYDDCDYDVYDEYYDGVGEDRSTSIFNNTKPTSSTSRSTTWYEETPLEKISKIAFPARFVAGRRQVTPSNKRKRILPGRSVSPKQSNSFASIPSSDLETVNNNETFEGVECQDCNSIEPRRSDRKRKHTEKFLSFTEDNNRVKSASYAKDNNRVPSNTAKVSTNNNSDDATVSNDDEVDVDIIKMIDIASSQNQFNESLQSNIQFVPTEIYSSYIEVNDRVLPSQRSSYLDQQASMPAKQPTQPTGSPTRPHRSINGGSHATQAKPSTN